jgi:16S rRNA (guanine966-N2)-methyltransferase
VDQRSPRRGREPQAVAAPAPLRQARSMRNAPQEVRLIGGTLRKSKLPVADRPGLRPTPDRVRETLFNWLGQDLSGWRVLDAFAGSGALGFEAASRGAAQVTLLERDAGLATSLRATAARLKIAAAQVEATDALTWMARAPQAGFELVLLDPPFDSRLQAPALAAGAPWVGPGGWLYLDAAAPLDAAELPPSLVLWRQGRAGLVHYHLLQRNN